MNEATAATGKQMAVSGDAGPICTFSATTDPSLLVYVQIYADSQSMATPKQIESGSEHLAGLGDDAFWTGTGILFVQKGSRGFTIYLPSLAGAGQNAPKQIVALATSALSRL